MTSIDYAALAREMRKKQPTSGSAKEETLKAPLSNDATQTIMQASQSEAPLQSGEEVVMLHPLTLPIPLPPNLKPFRLSERSAAYVPNILHANEEETLLKEINLAASKWTELTARRLQNWGGIVRASGMREEPLPPWLMLLQDRLSPIFPCPFNHVLINEYRAGQGILAHEDGPLYFPVVAIISLQAGIMIEFQKKRQYSENGKVERVMSVYLQPRSLFVFAEELYTHHLHCIEPRNSDAIDESCINATVAGVKLGSEEYRATRISLTIRVVPKVLRKK